MTHSIPLDPYPTALSVMVLRDRWRSAVVSAEPVPWVPVSSLDRTVKDSVAVDAPTTPTAEARREHACDVCGNWPDEYGVIEHGRGCFVVDEDGGGTSYVELPARAPATPVAAKPPVPPFILPDGIDPAMFRRAVELVIEHGRCSVEFLQAKLSCGYWTAAFIFDSMNAVKIRGVNWVSRVRAAEVLAGMEKEEAEK